VKNKKQLIHRIDRRIKQRERKRKGEGDAKSNRCVSLLRSKGRTVLVRGVDVGVCS
jgi:hypothetical protein